MANDEPTTLAVELRAMLEEKKANGQPRFSDIDRRAVQAIIYIELARRGDPNIFDPHQRQVLMGILNEIGINEFTEPEKVQGLVRAYFAKLNANPGVFVRLDRLLKRFQKLEDKVEAISQGATAYQKLTDQEGPKAPGLDEKAPEGSKAAQSLAQSLGVKVRI